ncbi:MAG: hypothetical protein U9N59_04030, partial [Campylobacterota bacterium]|nr:hypothetical protein [Campylobacterota bacterium]
LTEYEKRLDIGDNIEILYKEKLTPIIINGEPRAELKIVKGSYSIYDMEEYEYFSDENKVEMIAIEEYSDSPNSIYFNEEGVVESYEYENISTIELGDRVVFNIHNKSIISYWLTTVS